jgi:hypothetical protein
MTGNDTNTKGTAMNATKANLLAKLQAFADTLDINAARVEIGENADDKNVVWLCFRCIGCDPEKIAVGLVKSGIRRIKGRMKDFEASL